MANRLTSAMFSDLALYQHDRLIAFKKGSIVEEIKPSKMFIGKLPYGKYLLMAIKELYEEVKKEDSCKKNNRERLKESVL